MDNSTEASVRKKINLLVVAAGLGIGGAEVVIQRLAQTLDLSKFNLQICCTKGKGSIGEELARDGIEVTVLSDPDGPKVNYFLFLRLLRLIVKRKIDVVHTHTTDSLVDAAVCKLFWRKFKLVHTFHFGNYPHRPKRTLVMEGIAARLADQLIAVGEEQRRKIRSVYRLADESIGRVWNGVSVTPRSEGDSPRTVLKAQGQRLVGTVATLTEQKGLFDLLDVAAALRTEGVRFVVIGEGPLRSQLEARRREQNLEEIVEMPGWLPNAADIALPAFDVFFQPSLWEAMSISLLEAMTAGKAIVATRVGEAPRIIEQDVDGILVNAGDKGAMVAALRRLIADQDLRRRMGHAAAQKARREFTVEKMTKAYEEIYLKLDTRSRIDSKQASA